MKFLGLACLAATAVLATPNYWVSIRGCRAPKVGEKVMGVETQGISPDYGAFVASQLDTGDKATTFSVGSSYRFAFIPLRDSRKRHLWFWEGAETEASEAAQSPTCLSSAWGNGASADAFNLDLKVTKGGSPLKVTLAVADESDRILQISEITLTELSSIAMPPAPIPSSALPPPSSALPPPADSFVAPPPPPDVIAPPAPSSNSNIGSNEALPPVYNPPAPAPVALPPAVMPPAPAFSGTETGGAPPQPTGGAAVETETKACTKRTYMVVNKAKKQKWCVAGNAVVQCNTKAEVKDILPATLETSAEGTTMMHVDGETDVAGKGFMLESRGNGYYWFKNKKGKCANVNNKNQIVGAKCNVKSAKQQFAVVPLF